MAKLQTKPFTPCAKTLTRLKLSHWHFWRLAKCKHFSRNWPWQFQPRFCELSGGASRLRSYVCFSARRFFLSAQHGIFPLLQVAIFAYFAAWIFAQTALYALSSQACQVFRTFSSIHSLSPFLYICGWLIPGDITAAPRNLYVHPLFLGSSRSLAP